MSAHQYRITLEYLGGKQAGPELRQPVVFEAGNHDDIFTILESVQAARMFDRDTSAALVLGMKLFSEVMLKHKKDPLFTLMLAAYLDYIGPFKALLKKAKAKGQAGDQGASKVALSRLFAGSGCIAIIMQVEDRALAVLLRELQPRLVNVVSDDGHPLAGSL